MEKTKLNLDKFFEDKPMKSSPVPDYHSHEEFQNRSRKLGEIRDLGIDPYPHKFTPTETAELLHSTFKVEELENAEAAANGSTKGVSVAGRLVLFRAMGKNAFAQIQDETGRIQLMFNRDNTIVDGLDPEKIKPLKFIEKMVDLGDIVGVEGHIFQTKKGEMTIYVKRFVLLCKSLLPLPDKHAGLKDKGVRYRKRWLDLISTPESMQMLKDRSKIVRLVRDYMENDDFMEVETPVLQNIYGGAEARPFTTELNALHQEMFLRIAIEIALKKLVVGGLNRIYEIGKVFRNEGIDKTHNPEFTMLEAYAAYWDYNDMMVFVENLFEKIALELHSSTKVTFQSEDSTDSIEVDFTAPWKRLSMKDAIKDYAKIDVDTLDDEALRKLLKEKTDLDPKVIEKVTRGKLIALAFEEFAEEHLIQPHHITDHPIETTPLCKLHRDPKMREEQFVERFETFILGMEMVNSYSELNDPELQRKLLEDQANKKEEGDEEANPLDEEFIEAICQGMPPTAGVGIGIDRLVMLFTKAISIRDVLYFPLMRLEE